MLQALVQYTATDPSLSTHIANAVTTLTAQIDSATPDLAKGKAALALLRENQTSAAAQAHLNELLSTQSETDGSWQQDAYITASIIRAFSAANGTDSAALSAIVYIPDAKLRAAINAVLSKNANDALSKGELLQLTNLDFADLGITNLTGLEEASNLVTIDLQGNDINDLTSLQSLPNLQTEPKATVTTGTASLSASYSVINGIVNPNGFNTTAWIEWGLTTAYGNTSNTQLIGNDDQDMIISDLITGLTADTTYHYRVVASNSAEMVVGADATFTTLAGHAFGYYILNPNFDNNLPTEVTSLVNHNTITTGNTTLTLNRYESGTIPAVELVQSTLISGTGSFDVSSEENGINMPAPINFAGTAFVLPEVGGSVVSQRQLYILSPDTNATVQLGGACVATTLTAFAGSVLQIEQAIQGIDINWGCTITSDVPILVAFKRANTAQPFILPPAALEFYGIRSKQADIGALEDGTTVDIYASNGTSDMVSLDAGETQKVILGSNSTQGEGDALHIVANQPINVVQKNDGDGGSATAFFDRQSLSTRFGIPVDTQYIAVACPEANTTITLYDEPNPSEVQTCSGSATTPGKAYFGSATNGININAGAYLESDQPIFVMYEVSATDDEHNLLGTP